MRIYHNIPALTAYNALNHTSNALQKTIQKLSTGLRINSASDDAAGLAISEKMRAQISGLEMAQRNAQDGISMLQTAEGAIQSTQSILQRMRELAVQASNDTLTAEDRSYIQLEVGELRSEIDRIAHTTQFNGKRLLDGSSAGVVSSSNLSVKAYVRGSLREIDQFGQKKSFEGNYKIQIKASGVGEGQAQKSAIMVIKHPNVITDVQTNTKDGVNTVRVDNVPAGDYKVKAAVAANAGAKIVGSYGFNTEVKPANLYVGSEWKTAAVDFGASGKKIQLKLTKNDGSSHVSAALTLQGTFGGADTSTAATINEIKDEVQKQINANAALKGKISVDVNNGKLVFSSTDGELSFTGTDATSIISGATSATFTDVSGYSETLTGGRITSSLESTTTIKLSLTDAKGDYISNSTPKELKGISITIPKTAADTTSATRAAAINSALKTAKSASGADVDLSGVLSASVDPLGNVTLSSLVGHIDLNSTETADIAAVLGAPTQVSLRHQTVEDYLNVTANTVNNASILFEVTSVGSDTVTVKATSNVLTTDGTVKNYVRDNIILRTGNGTANAVNLGDLLGENETNFTLALGDGINSALFTSGNKFVYNVVGSGRGNNMADMSVTVEATQDPDWMERWGKNWTDANGAVRGEWASERLAYNLDSDAVGNKELHFRNFYVNSENGTVYEGNVVLTTTDNFTLGGMQTPATTTTASLGITNSASGAVFKLSIGGTSAAVYTTTGTEANAADLAEHILANIHAKIADGTFTNISASRDGANITITSVDGEEIKFTCTGTASTGYTVTGGTATASTPTAHQGNITTGDTLAGFTAAYIGKTATGDTKLRDLSAFWDSQGVFMLENPQTITITQGDGKSTSITVYATDTLNDLRQKLNNAIGSGLGQAQYATGDTDKFCTFVEKTPGVDMPVNGLETVAGTFIFRSLIPGAAGCLTFSGDQDVLNAFSLNVVHEPKETSFTASIYDAHTGQAIASNVKVTDNNLIGILHPNVDIEFDPMANVTAVWSESQSNFITQSKPVPYEAVIHLVDSSTVYQVGANKGEDLALDIGDMTAGSLGITKVNVATREAAARAIGQLDAAINKVSAQRAKIGAYQNSLEYTIENLQTTATNLTAAESRIRDADMAKTMMEFVKLQILNQSGTSMLAQANQLPQQVLSLLQ